MEASNGQVQAAPYRPGMPDRRQRKPDIWARAFRWLTLLVYPLLIVFFFIFFGVASADHNQAVKVQVGTAAPTAEAASVDMDLYTLLPLLGAGLLIGVVGLVLGRVRARRRSDYNFKTQLILVIVSVGGLVVFFLVR